MCSLLYRTCWLHLLRINIDCIDFSCFVVATMPEVTTSERPTLAQFIHELEREGKSSSGIHLLATFAL